MITAPHTAPPGPRDYPAPVACWHNVSQQDLNVYGAIVGRRPVLGLAPATVPDAAASQVATPAAAAVARLGVQLRSAGQEAVRRLREARERLARG